MRLEAYIRIIRPLVCTQVAALTLVGLVFAQNGFPELVTALKAFLSAFLIAASIHTINDYMDYEVDSVNTPWRPIPSGKIGRTEALVYGIVLGIVGVAVTLSVNLVAAALALAIFVLTNFYSYKGKIYGFAGHVIVAFCFASYFLFGALIAADYIHPHLLYIFGVCFLYILGGEVIQSISDAEGDKIRGVRSIALTSGPRMAAFVASACYILVALGGAYTTIQFNTGIDMPSSILAIVCTVFFVGVITLPLLRNPDRETAIKTRNRINALGFLIISGFLILLLI